MCVHNSVSIELSSQARAGGCSIISVAYPFSVTPIENTAGQVPRNLRNIEEHIDIDYLVDKSHTCSRVRSMGEYV